MFLLVVHFPKDNEEIEEREVNGCGFFDLLMLDIRREVSCM